MCQTMERESDADTDRADQAVEKLLENTAQALLTLDALLPEEHPARQAEHDQVAIAALLAVIAFGNKTANWKRCLELLEKIKPIAVGAATIERIEEAIAIAKRNLEASQCWFCGENPADDKCAEQVPMYGNVQTQYVSYNQTRTTWNYLTVKVPRCQVCSVKNSYGTAITVEVILCFILSFIGLDMIFNIHIVNDTLGNIFGLIWGKNMLLAFLVAMGILFCRLVRRRIGLSIFWFCLFAVSAFIISAVIIEKLNLFIFKSFIINGIEYVLNYNWMLFLCSLVIFLIISWFILKTTYEIRKNYIKNIKLALGQTNVKYRMRNDYPGIKELLNSGWKFGAGPNAQ
jgi:hypothetical protein